MSDEVRAWGMDLEGVERAEVHGLCDYGRRPYGFPVSRDWETLDCKAMGCKWNKNEHCMFPSQCKISDDGRCLGFVARDMQINKKPDGD